MDKPSLSIIIPTISRPSLRNLLERLEVDMGVNDETIVIGDGDKGAEAGMWINEEYAEDERFIFRQVECPTSAHGNGQRQYAIDNVATGDFLWFCDDDDNVVPGAIEQIIRPALAAEPNRPHIFRWVGGPSGDPVQFCNIGGPMLIAPNVRTKLGKWGYGGIYAQDLNFIRETLARYRKWPVYHDEEVYIVKPEV